MQTGFSAWIVGMRFACNCTAHLAGKAVAIKDISTRLFRNLACEGWLWFWGFEQVLTRLKVCTVIVGQDEVSLFGTQFTNTACPFTNTACNRAQRVSFQYFTNMSEKKCTQFAACT